MKGLSWTYISINAGTLIEDILYTYVQLKLSMVKQGIRLVFRLGKKKTVGIYIGSSQFP